MTRPEVIVTGAEIFAKVAALRLHTAIRRIVALRGSVSVALAGGNTPRPVYRELVRISGPLSPEQETVSWYFGDERGVPPDHPDSNHARARRDLLDPLVVPPDHVHRIRAEEPDLAAAAASYEAALPRPLDLVLLGVGDDGHTASLFPFAPALEETQRWVVDVHDAPGSMPRRVTLTPPALDAARNLLVFATGPQKARAIARALEEEGSWRETPARLARRATWILDRDAAAGLAEQTS